MKPLAYLFMASVVLASACAKTVSDTHTDGQTHWMMRCDANSDCGELQCICGVCTEPCSEDDACTVEGSDRGVCSATGGALDEAACEGLAGLAHVCVPACERQADCDDVTDGLVCSSEGACTVAARSPSTDAGNDGGLEADIELACGEDGELIGTGDYEVVASDEGLDVPLAIATDGTIYVAEWVTPYESRILRFDGAGSEPFAQALGNVRIDQMVVDGDELVVATSTTSSEVTIATVGRETEQIVILAREEAMGVYDLAFDRDNVYWVADIDLVVLPSPVYRTPRVAGATQQLGEVPSPPLLNTLSVLGEQVFFGASSDEMRLFRVAKDGSGAIGPAEGTPTTVAEMRSDGTHVFVALPGKTLGNPNPERGVGLMDPDTLVVDRYTESQASPMYLTLGGDFLYWIEVSQNASAEPERSLWSQRKNGEGDAQLLATITNGNVSTLGATTDSVYWLVFCPKGDPDGSLSHLVKIAASE